jgi:hypothetical protein
VGQSEKEKKIITRNEINKLNKQKHKQGRMPPSDINKINKLNWGICIAPSQPY